jgi:chaperone required for assembly of F1-ATPase
MRPNGWHSTRRLPYIIYWRSRPSAYGDGALIASGTDGMRDVLEEIFALESLDPADPGELARRNMRAVKRRFYEAVTVREEPGGFAVALDDRPIKTPARRSLAAPCRPLAEVIAEEWRAQADFIDPAGMPMTRLANTIIDGVAAAHAGVAAEIVKYLGSDLVCYRATAPQGLVARQALHWDPVLAWAKERLGADFTTVAGVTFRRQPDEAIARAETAIPRDPWRLGAVHTVTTLTGSALIALNLATGNLSLDEAWTAANVDEDWNVEFWGRDELGMQRRAFRFAEMTAAARVVAEMRPRPAGIA